MFCEVFPSFSSLVSSMFNARRPHGAGIDILISLAQFCTGTTLFHGLVESRGTTACFLGFLVPGVKSGLRICGKEGRVQSPPLKDGKTHISESDPLSSVIDNHTPYTTRLLPEVAMEVQKTAAVGEPYVECAYKEKHGHPSLARKREVDEKHEVVPWEGDGACEEQRKGRVKEADAWGVVEDPVNRGEGPNGSAGGKGRNEYDGQGTRGGAHWSNRDGRDGEKSRERKGEKKGGYGGSVEREVNELRGKDVGSEEVTWRDAMEERNKIEGVIGEVESLRGHAIVLEHEDAQHVKKAER